tara:strand:- start:59 stop:1000 length:942 start_codon:yes stop_codon:yes gene_type:complete
MATWNKVVVENASGTIAQKSAGLVDADYGDITVSSNSFTIDNNVVDASALNVADNGTSGQVLQSDGDGSFSWTSNVTSVALNDVTDVVESSLANLDVLSYDSGDSRWENKTLSDAGIAAKAHNHDSTYAGINGDAAKNFSVLDLTLGGNDIKASDGTVAVTTSGADVTVAGDLTVTGNDIKSSSATAITLSGADVTIAGDLTVSGSTVTTTTETLEIADNTLILNSDKTATADVDAGIIVERGGDGHNALFYWDEGDDRWCIGTNNEADLTSTPTYTGDVMLVRRDSSFDSDSTKVPVGHLQNISGVLYVRTA